MNTTLMAPTQRNANKKHHYITPLACNYNLLDKSNLLFCMTIASIEARD